MSDLSAIYQDIILDHYRKPRNFAVLEGASRKARGHNPLCGDRIDLALRVADGVVEEIAFQGAGCAISTASASLMTEAVKGKSVEEVERLFRSFHDMLTSDERADAPASDAPEMEKLEALSGVRRIPVRVKCATLAWHTLKSALDSPETEESAVSTE